MGLLAPMEEGLPEGGNSLGGGGIPLSPSGGVGGGGGAAVGGGVVAAGGAAAGGGGGGAAGGGAVAGGAAAGGGGGWKAGLSALGKVGEVGMALNVAGSLVNKVAGHDRLGGLEPYMGVLQQAQFG